ncbi:MAG: hypothetical protein JRE61_02085 [Deltaproteobacteria bacterium]|nr:hypothetical protein [Deltaproteobacteria bacterium]
MKKSTCSGGALSRVTLPARSCPGLALPVRHGLRLRRMPGGLGWWASLHGRRVGGVAKSLK